MHLKILGSGSFANGYVLDNGTEALLIEAGVPFLDVKKAVDFDISRIVGALVSHEHADHARHVQQLAAARVAVRMSSGTASALRYEHQRGEAALASGNAVRLGGFTVLPFDTQHDAAEPLGFVINHRETGNVLFATDTYYLRYRFRQLNNIMIECNYRMDILTENVKRGVVSMAQRNRTAHSHMEYATCIEALQANDLSSVNSIVLIHLSNGNSNAAEFQQGVRRATGKNVHVADKGMCLRFNKTPF
jgi:phosphoribosyl 1,2-cyclic phosphodiesterase